MIICVVGPTGVGKTKLSEELALKYKGIIINCDAMQIYKEMNIGTAKISGNEMESCPHYLFDIKSPNEEYSVYDYQKDVRTIIDNNKNSNIILVGGTGLYLKAALYNYEFDSHTKNEYEEYSDQELYELLKEKGKVDDIHINNRKRMISRLNASPNHNLKNELLYENVIFVGLTTDRDKLYKVINNRVDNMIRNGLLDEVKKLYKKYGNVRSLKSGIGYKELIDYIDGNITLEEAISLIKLRSRRYAKRQYTWFNNQMNVEWFYTDYDNFDNTISEVQQYIERYLNNE